MVSCDQLQWNSWIGTMIFMSTASSVFITDSTLKSGRTSLPCQQRLGYDSAYRALLPWCIHSTAVKGTECPADGAFLYMSIVYLRSSKLTLLWWHAQFAAVGIISIPRIIPSDLQCCAGRASNLWNVVIRPDIKIWLSQHCKKKTAFYLAKFCAWIILWENTSYHNA